MPLRSAETLLVRRARYGDRRAARLLAARHLGRVSVLATVVGDNAARAAVVAREVFAAAVRANAPFDEALERAAGAAARRAPDRDAALGRLLVLLVDLEDRPEPEVAALLGLSVSEAATLRSSAVAVAGVARAGRSCRGWGLASGRRDLTPDEVSAGDAHLSLCRHCRDRRSALDAQRRRLVARSAGVAGALGSGQLAALSLAPAAGSLLAGKAVAGAIGAVGAATLTAGSLTAAGALPALRERPAAVVPVPGAVAVAPEATPSPLPHVPAPRVAAVPTSTPAPATLPVPRLDVPVQSDAVDVPAVPLPTTLLPTTLLPSALPVPLPTSLPLPLPSAVSLP